MTSMIPMAGMAGGVGGARAGQMAGMAMQAALPAAQQPARDQLADCNGQIKAQDDLTVGCQLLPTGPTRPCAHSKNGQNRLLAKYGSELSAKRFRFVLDRLLQLHRQDHVPSLW
jgi:hypothetical protein